MRAIPVLYLRAAADAHFKGRVLHMSHRVVALEVEFFNRKLAHKVAQHVAAKFLRKRDKKFFKFLLVKIHTHPFQDEDVACAAVLCDQLVHPRGI